jgi:transposase InsO family protein
MQQHMTDMQKEASITTLCRVLGMSRSGWYTAVARAKQPRALAPDEVRLCAAFEQSAQTYGSRRLSHAVTAQGSPMGRYRARSLMRRHGLQAKSKHKFRHTTDSRHNLPVADNVLNRQFTPEAINQAWVCDITYIRTASGWLYLAAVLDLYSRKVVGWAMAPEMPASLVCEALKMALVIRQPPPGLVVHSDRGSQYASSEHQQLLASHQCVGSMSRKGNCWDNAVMERFFLSLKLERVWRKQYANHYEARADVADYIVGFYNTERLHSTLGYKSPAAFEQQGSE